MSRDEVDYRRPGFVSVWVGTFPSVEAAETYFGIPDEVGVYLPPEGFARDLAMSDLPAESLEVNFEQLAPRPLGLLLRDATFSASFMEQVIAAASRQGIQAAQGIALLYDFDYPAAAGQQGTTGPLRFVGSFPFIGPCPDQEPKTRRDPRIEIRGPMENLL
jgi:hypothetical protein